MSVAKSCKEVAEQLVLEHAPRYAGESGLLAAIEAALKERDKRAAKIAETIPNSKFDLDHEPAPTEQQIRNGIAALIRGQK